MNSEQEKTTQIKNKISPRKMMRFLIYCLAAIVFVSCITYAIGFLLRKIEHWPDTSYGYYLNYKATGIIATMKNGDEFEFSLDNAQFNSNLTKSFWARLFQEELSDGNIVTKLKANENFKLVKRADFADDVQGYEFVRIKNNAFLEKLFSTFLKDSTTEGVEFNSCCNLSISIADTLQHSCRLKNVVIENAGGLPSLAVLEKMNNLKSLSIHIAPQRDIEGLLLFHDFIEGLQFLKNVEYLEVTGLDDKFFEYQDGIHFVESVSELPKLKTFITDFLFTDDEILSRFEQTELTNLGLSIHGPLEISLLSRLPNLETVQLNCENLVNNSISRMTPLLNLHEIKIWLSSDESTIETPLALWLKSCPNLRKVSLHATTCSNEAFRVLKEMDNLDELELPSNWNENSMP